MGTTKVIIIRVGQIWVDLDPRHGRRKIRVIRVWDGGFEAVVTAPKNLAGRTKLYDTRKFLGRMGTRSGYALEG